MRTFLRTMKVCYWIGAILSFVIVFESIGRGTASPWIWEQIPVSFERSGIGEAAFATLLYLIFYTSSFCLPYAILSRLFADNFSNNERVREALVASDTAAFGVSAAMFVTLNLFLQSFATGVMAFASHIPQGTLAEWLIVVWLIVTPLMLYTAFDALRKERQERQKIG